MTNDFILIYFLFGNFTTECHNIQLGHNINISEWQFVIFLEQHWQKIGSIYHLYWTTLRKSCQTRIVHTQQF